MTGELESRFSNDHEGLVAVQYMIPSCLSQLTEHKVESLHSFYGKFLSIEENENLAIEVTKWKKFCQGFPAQEKHKNTAVTLSVCNIPYTAQNFHNISNYTGR